MGKYSLSIASYEEYFSRIFKGIEREKCKERSIFDAKKEADYSLKYLKTELNFLARIVIADPFTYDPGDANVARFHFYRATKIIEVFELGEKMRRRVASIYLAFDRLRTRLEEEVKDRYTGLFDADRNASFDRTREAAKSLLS